MYYPFPFVKSIFYVDVDLYYYFLGRDDQSVTMKNMIKRIDQQIRVAKLMTECHDPEKIKKEQPQLYKYMLHELSMMYTISYVFLAASKQKENYQKIKDIPHSIFGKKKSMKLGSTFRPLMAFIRSITNRWYVLVSSL